MARVPRTGIPIATPGRRFLAATVDSLPFVALMIASRRASGTGLRRWNLALLGIEAVYDVSLVATRGQTVGQALAGIRIVDRTTLDRPGWRQSAVRWLVGSATHIVPLLLPEPRSVRALEELRPEVQRLRREHKGDQAGLNEALMRLYRTRQIRPWAGLPRVFALVIVDGTSAWMRRQGPLHQALHDRAANTVVIQPAVSPG